tara:strand:+ start:989 stop:1912 length:924 start_codon:yes stop_codon:yes gene_type:complete
VVDGVKKSFSIKNLETISGIKAHTIRIWEKRYKLLSPERTDTNIRKYSLKSLKKLLSVTLLYKSGFKISKIAKKNDKEIKSLVNEISIKSHSETRYINSIKLSMIGFDNKLFNKTFDDILSKYNFEFAYMRVFLPLMRELGILWQTESISTSHEHFITNLIKQKIHVQTESLKFKNWSNYNKTFVLFLPENEFHELSILFLNYILLLHGMKTIFLGQSIPSEDLVDILNNEEAYHFLSFFTVEPNKNEIFNYMDNFEKKLLIGNDNEISLFGPQIITIKNDIRWKKVNLFFDLDDFKNQFLVKNEIS